MVQSEQHVIYRLMAGGGGTWRSAVRSAMVAVSRIPRRGTTDVDDVPAPA